MNRSIMIVILVGILLGGGYWYYSNEQEKREMAEMAAAEAAAAEAAAAEAAAAGTANAETEIVPGTGITQEMMATAADLLTPEGYDKDKVLALVDASAMADVQKLATKTALEAAGEDAARLAPVLAQIKASLGL